MLYTCFCASDDNGRKEMAHAFGTHVVSLSGGVAILVLGSMAFVLNKKCIPIALITVCGLTSKLRNNAIPRNQTYV